MKVYAIANQKGGVAKTTSTLNLAAGLSDKGFKVLIIDIDPQCNLSTIADAINDGFMDVLENAKSMENVFKEECLLSDAIQHKDKFDIVPASMQLSLVDSFITSPFGKMEKLKKAINSVASQYDYVFIDCPPSLGTLTANALVAANEVIVPASADILSYQGTMQLLDTVNEARALNKGLKVTGILITRFNKIKRINGEVLDMFTQLATEVGSKVFNAKIRECSAIAESQAQATDVFSYSKSNASADYGAACKEIFNLEEEDDK